jgi:transcriptional regulator with XRE-family HTH domain
MSGMTLKEVASGADTSISYLSKVESGKFVPSQDYVARVAFVIAKSMLPETTTGSKAA